MRSKGFRGVAWPLMAGLLAATVLSVPACAQVLTWQADQLIDDNAGKDGNLPQVAMSGSSVVAVWRQGDGGTGSNENRPVSGCAGVPPVPRGIPPLPVAGCHLLPAVVEAAAAQTAGRIAGRQNSRSRPGKHLVPGVVPRSLTPGRPPPL